MALRDDYPFYPGPFEEPEWGVSVPFPSGDLYNCPVISATRTEGIQRGPGWYSDTIGQSYSSSCSGNTRMILHSIETVKSVSNVTNEFACPDSWGNTQTSTIRYPVGDFDQVKIDVFGNSEFGAQYYEYTDCYQDPSTLRWSYTKTTWKTTMLFVPAATVNVCPPGTEFNPYTGTCDILPDYVWDPTTGTYITPHCIKITGDNSICRKDTYIYTVKLWNYIDDEPIFAPEDIVVEIDYPFGSIRNNLHFSAPVSVTIPQGESSVDFELTLYNYNDDEGYFNIAISSDKYDRCEDIYKVDVNCDGSPEEGNIYTGACCAHVPKDYLLWEDNIPELTAPQSSQPTAISKIECLDNTNFWKPYRHSTTKAIIRKK